MLYPILLTVFLFHLTEPCANCNYNNCYTDGRCTHGCKTGYYGSHCTHTCRLQCLKAACSLSVETGSAVCTLGCIDGWKGINCEVRCPRRCAVCNTTTCLKCEDSKWYGTRCETYCQRCKENLCFRNGTCKKGCIGSFKGPWCNISCDLNCVSCDREPLTCSACRRGYFGHRCFNRCSPGCHNSECNITTGSCIFGCVPGRQGTACTEPTVLESPNERELTSTGTPLITGSSSHSRRTEDNLTPFEVLITDSEDNEGITLIQVVIVTSVVWFLMLLSFCVVIRFCKGYKKTSKQTTGNTHQRLSRHKTPTFNEPIYAEICECDVTSVINDSGRRGPGDQKGYLTPSYTACRSEPAASTRSMFQQKVVFDDNRAASFHTNQSFTENCTGGMSGDDCTPTMCTGSQRMPATSGHVFPPSGTAPRRCGSTAMIHDRRVRNLPRSTWSSQRHCVNFQRDKWSLGDVASPWQKSPTLRNKFIMNTKSEQVLKLMPEDSPSEDESLHP